MVEKMLELLDLWAHSRSCCPVFINNFIILILHNVCVTSDNVLILWKLTLELFKKNRSRAIRSSTPSKEQLCFIDS